MSAYKVCCPTARLEKLLVATDGSKFSAGAIKESINLAKVCSSKVYIESVIEFNPEFEAIAPQLLEKAEKETREHLEAAKAMLSKEGIDCEIIVHEGEEPFRYIVDEAAKKKVEMIIMGRHGRTGLKRLLMGGVASRVIGHAPCKVLIVPKTAAIAYRKLLVATDGSKYSEAAFLEAISIAKRCGSDLIALSVAATEKNLAEAKKNVNKVKQVAEKEDVKAEILTLRGNPYEVIVKTADRKNADIIVVGSHGKASIEKLLMGSVTERVIGHTERPVLVVKA
jgi:nucleotide-binding universal stress UspA family protein